MYVVYAKYQGYIIDFGFDEALSHYYIYFDWVIYGILFVSIYDVFFYE